MIHESRWDIGEQVVTKNASPRRLSGVIAASSRTVVFGVLTFASAAFPTVVPMSQPHSVLEIIRVTRKDAPGPRPAVLDRSDTRQGMSTGRLAALFPVLFEPSEDDAGDPHFMD
jgi:hypothetical protein